MDNKLQFDETGTILIGCDKKASEVKIPDTVTRIGDSAFHDCWELPSIEIPDSVSSIGESAFSCCLELTSVEIPDSVTSIGKSAFGDCIALKRIVVSKDNSQYMDLDGVLYSKDGTRLLCYPAGKKRAQFIVPKSVTSIEDYAFCGSDYLSSIEIPKSVTSIGSHAFDGCCALASIEIPDSVSSIGSHVFYDCESLHSIKIPDSVTSIGASAFGGCESLHSIEIPNSVTSIGNQAFSICWALTSIEIPDSVTSIGESAFYGSLVLKRIVVSKDNSQYMDLDGVLYSKDGSRLLCCPAGKKDAQFNVPDSVTSIGERAFYGCDSLTSIEIPDSVTSIGNHAFWGCESLHSIEIPKSVTSIGESAFESCHSLTTIKIPDSVTSMGKSAFHGCSKLTSIEIPDSVTSIGESAFRGCHALERIVVSKDNSQYMDLDGVLYSKDGSHLLCYPAGKKDEVFLMPKSVRRISGEAFRLCTHLREFYLRKENPNDIKVDGYTFSDLEECTLFVPVGAEYAYRYDERFKGFKEIKIEKKEKS